MQMSQIEQKFRLTNQVPSLEEYWRYRLGTSAVYIGIAACEYSTGSRLDNRVYDSPHMQIIWDETNFIISLVNDLLSLRKEIHQGCVESYVPLACASGKTVDDAITDATRELRLSRCRLEIAAAALKDFCETDGILPCQVEEYIGVCKSNCVGNLAWR